MSLIEEFLDEIIEESLLKDIPQDELFSLIVETVKRRKMLVGGVHMTVRKMGRPNAARSIKAKMTARRFAGKRKLAMRKFARSARGKRMRQLVTRYRKAHPHSHPKTSSTHHRPPKMHAPKAPHRHH